MLDILHYLIAAVFILLVVWVIIKGSIYFVSLMVPSREIVFAPFEASDSNLGGQAPRILSAKLRQLQLYATQPPTGYGFLELPVLAKLPLEAETQVGEKLKQLENIQLKVKDVDIPAVIKAIQTIFSPPQYELKGRITELPDSIEVNCELVYKDRPLVSWHSRSRMEPSKPTEKTVATAKALDDIVFQMIYDFLTNTQLKSWKIFMTKEYHPENWQTLQVYTHGVQALRIYQQTLDYQDLKEALQYLERLPIVAPDNPEGLYYYGIALSEDRQEAEAVAVFEQLQRMSNAKEEIKLEAKFNEAVTRLKLYRLSDAKKALKTLNELIEDLKKRINEISGKDSKEWYYRKLLTVSYAQCAYTEGTILSFLHYEKLESSDEVKERHQKVESYVNSANTEFKTIGHWNSDREKKDVLFRIKNANGYSTFRYAQYQQDQEEFIKLCNSAISDLEEANRERPNHYEVLQNLAMIYEDERFDPSGRYLGTAEMLYERTKRFVPNDYYQYEHLAKIQWRRLEKVSVSGSNKAIIEKGKNNALKAKELRPLAGETLLLLALFAVRSWEIAMAEKVSGDQMATEALGYFKEALVARPEDPEIRFKYGSFLLGLAKMEEIRDEKKHKLEQAVDQLNKTLELTARRKEKQQLHDSARKLLREAQNLLKQLGGT